MIVGLARCECLIYDAASLKDKRAVLQRIITRIRQRLNVSVSEVDYQDAWQRTAIAITAVASSKVPVEQEIQNALKLIDSFPEIERTITDIEWL
ncbi:YlxP [Bacillus sp. B-jedd]|nr:YlxP [Bacillus sp. B-jedd]